VTPSPRRLLSAVVRYGIGLLAVAWLVDQLRFDRLAAVLSDVAPETVVALLAVTGVGLVARFWMWHALINRLGEAPFRTAASTDLIVNFVNQLLPSRLSGRAAAPLVLRSETGMAVGDAVALSGVHTGLYAALYGLGALVGLAVALGYGRLSAGLTVLLALSTALYLAAGTVVLLAGANLTALDRTVDALAALARRLPVAGERIADRVTGLPAMTAASARSFRVLSTDPRAVASYAAGWAGAMLLAPGARVWLLLGVGGPAGSVAFEPALALPFFLLAAYSVTLLPLTPGGIGVTEATATAAFVAFGVPAEVAAPVVFADRVLGVYLPALGGWYPSARLDVSWSAAE